MALVTPLPGITLNNRMRGVVWATQNVGDPTPGVPASQVLTVRHAGIPVSPKTFTQATSQVNFSTAVYSWRNMGPVGQSAWNAIAPTGSTGQATFIAMAQLQLTWGCQISDTVPFRTAGFDISFITCGQNTGPNDGFMQVTCDDVTGFYGGLWARIYIQYSSLMPVVFSGDASSTPGLPAPSPAIIETGYVFFGSAGPFDGIGPYLIDMGDIFNTYRGQTPTTLRLITATNMFQASFTDFLVYWTDEIGQNILGEYNPYEGTPPPSLGTLIWDPGPFHTGTAWLPAPPTGFARSTAATGPKFYPAGHRR
jgi:hypothetical protein